jgi:hypothetical protein
MTDPARHLLAERWNKSLWYRAEPPAGSDPPVPIDAHVAEWRAAIEAGRELEPHPSERRHTIVLSHQRVEVICNLLRELSKRTRPGVAVGPVQSDGSISQLAIDLAEDLRNRIF